jgi:hypothetical protein
MVIIAWTHGARRCYELGGDCDRCHIPKIMESPCFMAESVHETLAVLGPPGMGMSRPREPQHKVKKQYPDWWGAVFGYIRDNPECQTLEIRAALFPERPIQSMLHALGRGFDMGILDRRMVNLGWRSGRAYLWTYKQGLGSDIVTSQ